MPREYVGVVSVNGVTWDLDFIRIAFFYVCWLIAKPLIPDNSAVNDCDNTVIVYLEPSQKRFRGFLTFCDTRQIVYSRASHVTSTSAKSCISTWNSCVLQEIDAIDFQGLDW